MYINLNYKPNPQNDLIAIFHLEANGSLKEAASAVAGESSIGSWTDLSTLKKSTAKKLQAQVFSLNEKTSLVKIAYPLDLFELNSIPQFLSSVGGNIFSMKMVKNLRLIDVEFPSRYVKSFLGPAFGLAGIRKILGNKNKLILGSIIKPKVGLNPDEQAELSYKIWKNGIDLVKDDENLTSLSFNNFEERVTKVLKMLKRAEKERGKVKFYSANVTAPPDVMLERAKFVKRHGGRVAMVDIISMGLDNVQYLRKQNLGLILHGHRAGHSTFTRNPYHGISMMVVAKLSRLAGIDQLHTGTVVGKMEGTASEVSNINQFLTGKWYDKKPILPIASGGLHPGLLPGVVQSLGHDLIVNFGGGVHGHQAGSEAGALACSQAVEAISKGISLDKYALRHQELAQALKQWGGVRYED